MAEQVPGLAVVLVGARKDSETYVRNKRKNCEEVGYESFQMDLPEDVSQEDLLKVGPKLQMNQHGSFRLSSAYSTDA